MISLTAKEAMELFKKMVKEDGKDAPVLLTFWDTDDIKSSYERLGVSEDDEDVKKLDIEEILGELEDFENGICVTNDRLDEIIKERLLDMDTD